MPDIQNAKIAILSTHGFEQSELEVPLNKLREAGADVHVISLEEGEIKGWDGDDWGQSGPVDKTLDKALVTEYDCLVLPGGQINPDLLRVNDDAVAFVRDFVASGKIVAAICHAPWLLIEAEVVDGREMTSYPSIKTDMVNAGAKWVDASVATDDGIITSRNPDDLDNFVAKIIEEIREGRHPREEAA